MLQVCGSKHMSSSLPGVAVTIPTPRAGCLRLNLRVSRIGNELPFTTSLDQTVADSVLKVLMPTNTEAQQKEE